jgi:hypothetical protein
VATYTAPAVLDALRANLILRAGIIGPPKVEVYTAGMADDTALEAITFFSAEGEQRWAVMPYSSSRGKSDEYTIAGQVLIRKAGAGEATAVAARNRCLAIFNEVENALRTSPTLGTPPAVAGVTVVAVGAVKLQQGLEPGFRRCGITFEIDCRYRI